MRLSLQPPHIMMHQVYLLFSYELIGLQNQQRYEEIFWPHHTPPIISALAKASSIRFESLELGLIRSAVGCLTGL